MFCVTVRLSARDQFAVCSATISYFAPAAFKVSCTPLLRSIAALPPGLPVMNTIRAPSGNLFTTYFARAAAPATLSRQKKGMGFFAPSTYRSKLTTGMPASKASLTAGVRAFTSLGSSTIPFTPWVTAFRTSLDCFEELPCPSWTISSTFSFFASSLAVLAASASQGNSRLGLL